MPDFPGLVLKEALLFSSGIINVGAGLTDYLSCPEQGGVRNSGPSASEATTLVNYLVTRPGVLDNLVAISSGVPGVAQSFTYTVRVNGAPTALLCVTAGGAAKSSSDLVDIVKVYAGDRVTVQIVVSAGAAVTNHTVSVRLTSQAQKVPFEHAGFNTGATTVAVATTIYLGYNFRNTDIVSLASASEVTPTGMILVVRKGRLRNLVALAAAAPGAGQTFVYTIRVNAVPTALTVTLSGAAQLTGLDSTDAVEVHPGDFVSLQLVTSAAAAVVTHAAAFDFEEGDYVGP